MIIASEALGRGGRNLRIGNRRINRDTPWLIIRLSYCISSWVLPSLLFAPYLRHLQVLRSHTDTYFLLLNNSSLVPRSIEDYRKTLGHGLFTYLKRPYTVRTRLALNPLNVLVTAWKIVATGISRKKSMLKLEHHLVLLLTMLPGLLLNEQTGGGNIDRWLRTICIFWIFSPTDSFYWTQPQCEALVKSPRLRQ